MSRRRLTPVPIQPPSLSSLLLQPTHENAKATNNSDYPPRYLPDDHFLSHLLPAHHTEFGLVCTAQLHMEDVVCHVQTTLYSSSFYFRFDRAATAYALLSSKVECSNVRIPRVLGFMRWSSSAWEQEFPCVQNHGQDVFAIIMERLGDSFSNMSSENITMEGAANAIISLEAIHRLGILHGDVRDNLLHSRDREIMWVGFDNCQLPSEATSADLENEMRFAMELIFGYYVLPFDILKLTK